MQHLGNGLYALDDPMPYTPRDVTLRRYILPDTLGHMELEEAAARVIAPSVTCNRWVGVSWKHVIDTMLADCNAHRRACDVQQQRYAEMRRFERATLMHYALCALTAGMYAIVTPAPTMRSFYAPAADNVPVSSVFAFGPEYVIRGVKVLIEANLLRYVRTDTSKHDDAIDSVVEVLCPTPMLVQRIVDAQRRRPIHAT